MQYLCFKRVSTNPSCLKPAAQPPVSKGVPGGANEGRTGPSFETRRQRALRHEGGVDLFRDMRMAREMIRQGGRSARIQEAVHAATQALLNEVGRSAINVPMIAERAGVTPSTVYRRWGDLAQLLADAAAERLRPIADPDDTGSLAGDLRAFVLQYAEEMGSPVGRALMRDVLAETDFGSRRRALLRLHDPSPANPQQPRPRARRGRLPGRRSNRHPDRANLLPHPVRERRALAGLCERAPRALRQTERRNDVKAYTEETATGVGRDGRGHAARHHRRAETLARA